VLDLLVLLLSEECGKDVLPALHARKHAKDGVDTLESHFVVVVVRPVKVDDLGTFRFDFLTEAMVSSNNSVAFPDTDTRGCMASFQQAKDNTVADDAASIRNENRAKTRVKVNYKAKATLRDKKWLHGSHRDPADQQQI
jgi:hypothetical protein